MLLLDVDKTPEVRANAQSSAFLMPFAFLRSTLKALIGFYMCLSERGIFFVFLSLLFLCDRRKRVLIDCGVSTRKQRALARVAIVF